MLRSLKTNQIDIWYTFPSQIQDSYLLKAYESLLSTAEKERMQRFRFTRDRHQFLITRALIRTTLSRYAPIAPEKWAFYTNDYGKPNIANDDSLSKTISFNVSHTQDMILLGVALKQDLGVDVENICSRHAPLDIADKYFADNEIAALYALPAELQSKQFFAYWTLKESYVKARGVGLLAPLNLCSFHYSSNAQISVTMDPQLRDCPSRWKFWQFQPSPEHIAAVCISNSKNPPQQISIQATVPLMPEEAN